MREIKFRALELDVGRFVFGYYVAEHGYYMNNGTPDLNKPVVRHYIVGDSGKHDVCEDTVCQYTGLKDKNGVGLIEVFEGDIISSDGILKGNIYENNKESTDLAIPPIGTKAWIDAYKEAVDRGYGYAE